MLKPETLKAAGRRQFREFRELIWQKMDAGSTPDAPFPLIITFSRGEKEREADAAVLRKCS
jgi:hypothetical protein